MIQAQRDSHALFHHHGSIEQKIIVTDNVQAFWIKILIHQRRRWRNGQALAWDNQRNANNILHPEALFLSQRMCLLHQKTDGVSKRQLKCVIFPDIIGFKQQTEVQQAFIQLIRNIIRVSAVQIEVNSGMILL